MKKVTFAGIVLLIAATSSFGQVVGRPVLKVKLDTAQKALLVKASTSQKTTPANILTPQPTAAAKTVIPQNEVSVVKKEPTAPLKMKENKTSLPDSSFSKLTGVTVQIAFTNAYNAPDYVLSHYRPQLFLYDDNNKIVAHWDISMKSQGPTKDADQMSTDVTFLMNIDEAVPFIAFKNTGRFRIGFQNFTNGGLDGGGADWIRVTYYFLTLQFGNPSFNEQVWVNDPNIMYNVTNYFSYRNLSCPTPFECTMD
jgi:hypothetical protein